MSNNKPWFESCQIRGKQRLHKLVQNYFNELQKKGMKIFLFLHNPSPPFSSVVQQPNLGLGCLTIKISTSYTITHTPSMTPLNKCTSCHTHTHTHKQTQDTNIHDCSMIWTWNPSNHTAADICLNLKQPNLPTLNITCKIIFWTAESKYFTHNNFYTRIYG
jgi:hypothetical protein